MKIGLIGLGYWGKILLNNLNNLGYNDITICDSVVNPLDSNLGSKYKFVNDYKKVDCEKVFVVIPASNHFEVVKYFLEKKIDVFCEKPLTITLEDSEELYKLAEKNKVKLFVDWIFTFNNQIIEMKKNIKKNNYKIKNVILNRLNFGPERFDVNSVYDLASHDVSIVTFLFEKEPTCVKWINFKRNNKSKQNDSTIGVLIYDDFTVQINTSWFYGEKYRKCYFEFEEGFMYWDDLDKSLINKIPGSKEWEFSTFSPLEKSINSFLIDDNFNYTQQKSLTLITQKIIEQGYDKI